MSRTLQLVPYNTPVERLVAMLFEASLSLEEWHCIPLADGFHNVRHYEREAKTFESRYHDLSVGTECVYVSALPVVPIRPVGSRRDET